MAITAEDVYTLAPYARTLGVLFETMDPGTLVTHLPYSHDLSTTGGGLHGGALMGLADVTAAVCAVLNAPPGSLPATTTSTTHFLRPVRGNATATATPLDIGRSAVVVRVDITDDTGQVKVTVVQTVTVRTPAGGTAP